MSTGKWGRGRLVGAYTLRLPCGLSVSVCDVRNLFRFKSPLLNSSRPLSREAYTVGVRRPSPVSEGTPRTTTVSRGESGRGDHTSLREEDFRWEDSVVSGVGPRPVPR